MRVAGNLNFRAVTQEDIDDDAVWKCHITNSFNDVTVGGSESKIVASGQSPGEFHLL